MSTATPATSPSVSTVSLPASGLRAQDPRSRLSVWKLLNLCIGVIGIQFAWSMQIALSSRVLEPLGANPFLFGLIWCAGPITGLLVQPLVGSWSDRTWTRLGRRKPFILAGAILGSVALLGFPYAPSLLVAALLIWVIDACVNVSQGPYRALVPDTIHPEQQGVANSYLNFAFGAGSVISLGVAPLLQLMHVEMTVDQQYVMAALALLLLTGYTALTIKEIRGVPAPQDGSKPLKGGLIRTFGRFLRGSREVHKLCTMQFFTWVGVMCMFIYLTPFVVHQVYQVPDLSNPGYKRLEAIQHWVQRLGGDRNLPVQVTLTAPSDPMSTSPLAEIRESAHGLGAPWAGVSPTTLMRWRDDLRAATEETKAQLAPALTPLAGGSASTTDLSAQLATLAASTPAVTEWEDLRQRVGNGGGQALAHLAPGFLANGAVEGTNHLATQVLGAAQQLATVQEQRTLADTLQAMVSPNPAAVSPAAAQAVSDLRQFVRLKKLENDATTTAQLALVAFNAVCLVLSLPLGYLSQRIGKKRLYTVCLAAMAAAFFAAPWIRTPAEVIGMMALAGVAWATILSVPFAFLCDYLPPGEEGSMMGIFNMFVAGPQLISATVIGWWIAQSPIRTVFGTAHNWSLAFVVAAVFLILAIGVLQTLQEKTRGLAASGAGGGGH